MKLVLTGAPGAGKGTQGEIISGRLGIPVISTGQILRSAIKNGTPVGREAKEYIDKGELVPDEVILGIVRERLAADDCKKGYILDGVPRTIAQAEMLEEMGVQIDAVLCIDVRDDVIEQRMTGRRVCPACGETYHIVSNPSRTEGICDKCGQPLTIRSDDAPETVRGRLAVYHRQTEPLLAYYQGRKKIITVDGERSVAEATDEILKALGIEA